jgi:7-cyano-7-deazaguanine tRNA-ribosyltransferase
MDTPSTKRMQEGAGLAAGEGGTPAVRRAHDFRTRGGAVYAPPLFMAVYQPRSETFALAAWEGDPPLEAIIINAYFLYKQRELRKLLTSGTSLQTFSGFSGLVATDSGAFQGLSRQLYLSNKNIVTFQDGIGSDVIAPLDLITPPGDGRQRATAKMQATESRVAEALRLAEHGIVAGVQQGGRFLDLRHETTCRLLEMRVEYLAIGSLVPFLTRSHDLRFTAATLADARRQAGPAIPMHVYGAGDPCELPFMVACGATIFDSSSYGHYGNGGWYMTPYGAVQDPGRILAGEFACACPICTGHAIEDVFADATLLSRHGLWTICETIRRLKHLIHDPDGLAAYLEHVLEVHTAWFPESRLLPSWRESQDRLRFDTVWREMPAQAPAEA